MTSPLDPSTVPLPPGDDTAYFNTPQTSVFAATPNTHMYGSDEESTPQTTRALPPFRHPDLASSDYSNMNTPTPVGVLGPDMETPRGRPQRRGGKYHPGATSALRKSADLGPSAREPSQSSGPDSGSDEEEDLMSEEEGFGNNEYEDLDRTVAINFHSQTSVPLNMGTPLQRQFPGLHFSTRSRRTTGRSSPGQTPARKLLANSKNFFGETPVMYQKNATTFMNPDILPSAFSEDTLGFPCLSAATPHKLNTIQGSPAGINPYELSIENSQLNTQLREKDAKIRYLEDMLSGGQPQDFEDFFDFSPEKKLKLNPMSADDDPPLTVKKRRQSPTKSMSSARKSRTSPRKGSRSPAKPSSLGLFESIMTPAKLTVEERKEARRRRETREFREFSAIDLEMLKSYLPPVVSEEKMEDVAEEVPAAVEAPKSPAKSPKESTKVDEVEQPEAETAQVEAPKPTITIPPTPARRVRQRRSNSAPPVPETLDAKVQTDSPRKPAFLQNTATIATLQARVAQLEEDLEITSISLQKAVAALEGERRARISAEETWRFLEIERKFGVCCQFAEAAGRTATEAAATVPLPSSPVESVRSTATKTRSERHPSKYATRPPSRMQSERPESRMAAERPSSRMAIDRPSSRMERERPSSRMDRERGGYGTSKIGAAPAATATTGKKRLREESANSGVGMRKAPIPRQAEKRVLSGGVGAANVPLGGGASQSGGVLKKPALGAGVAAPPMKAPVRAVGGAAAGTRSMTGLARGARR